MWSKTGPLFIGNYDRTMMLALMDEAKQNNGSINWVAFSSSGQKFIDFVSHVDDLNLFLLKERVIAENVIDHDISFSIYFDDPDGNNLNLTRYVTSL